VNWAMVRCAINSVASLCVVPLQDVLGLGGDSRMNVPSRPAGNWRWRFRSDLLKPEIAAKLATLVEVADRLPNPVPAVANEEWAA